MKIYTLTLNPAYDIHAYTAHFEPFHLSVLLQEKSDLTPEKYITFHPGGMLGQLRDNEK